MTHRAAAALTQSVRIPGPPDRDGVIRWEIVG